MTTFKEIALKNDQPTEQGIRAMEMVYEKLMRLCWHRGYGQCEKCGQFAACGGLIVSSNIEHLNSDLLTSLDAWRPLWERVTHEQKFVYHSILSDVRGDVWPWEAQPHHHTEAALRTLEDDCPDCEDISESILKALGRFHPQAHVLAVWRYEIAKDMSIAAFRKVIDKLVSEGLLTLGIVGADNHCNVFPHLTGKGLMASITYKSTCTCNDGKRTLWELWEGKTS